AISGSYFYRNRALVFRRNSAKRSMDLNTLVVAIGSTSRIGNNALSTGSGRQNDARTIEIAKFSDFRIDKDRRRRRYALYFLPKQKTRHIEIVDCHVAKNATRYLDIFGRRSSGIAAGDRYHFDVADTSVFNGFAYCCKMRIETAIETKHHLTAGFANDGEAGSYTCNIKID